MLTISMLLLRAITPCHAVTITPPLRRDYMLLLLMPPPALALLLFRYFRH